jgi:hypothetical protein
MGDRIETDVLLHDAMVANHLENTDDKVNLEGALYHATAAKQREEHGQFWMNMFMSAAVHLVGEDAMHVALHHVDKPFVKPGPAIVMAGYETISKNVETINEGDELKEGIKREYGVGACVMLCQTALPPGFQADVYDQFFKKGEASPGAVAVYQTIMSQPGAEATRDGFVANCKDGQRYALDRHILTQDDLKTALLQNPELRNRYRTDLAFKLGVDSVIWANSHGGVAPIEASLAPAPQPVTTEVRG